MLLDVVADELDHSELEDDEVDGVLEGVVGSGDDEGVGVGVGVGVGDGDGLGELESGFDDDDSEELESPPALKTTTLAVPPLGTVTTQKSAPPAPVALSALFTLGMLPELEEGSILHGRPLHPPPGHSMLTPNFGAVPERLDPVQIGFNPILAKVVPSAMVLAPATYGAQFP